MSSRIPPAFAPARPFPSRELDPVGHQTPDEAREFARDSYPVDGPLLAVILGPASVPARGREQTAGVPISDPG